MWPGIVSSLLGPPTAFFKDVKSGDTEHYRNTWKNMEGRISFPSFASELGLAITGDEEGRHMILWVQSPSFSPWTSSDSECGQTKAHGRAMVSGVEGTELLQVVERAKYPP